jgi:enoyl-CoA hydratase/carnithine racemase
MTISEEEFRFSDSTDTTAEPLVVVKCVDIGHSGEAAIVSLNRPDALNAISWDMVRELGRILPVLDADRGVRVILITGRGRAFSAGGDLKGYLDIQSDAVLFPKFIGELVSTFAAIRTMTKPVVALVNGVTVAGGLELLLACDFAYAARSALIGDGHLNFGQAGGGGSLTLLPRTILPPRARELMFTGELLTAEEAYAQGIVNRVVNDGALVEAGLDFARKVAAKSRTAVETMKVTMNEALADGTGVDAALELEQARVAAYCVTHPDAREGLLAFSEKRRPVFLDD